MSWWVNPVSARTVVWLNETQRPRRRDLLYASEIYVPHGFTGDALHTIHRAAAHDERERTIEIRKYQPTDKQACLKIMASNTPEFFARHEVSEFEEYLDNLSDPYFVVEDQGAIVACGGWRLRPDGTAALCWGMVRRADHHGGIGTLLTRERLRLIREQGRASRVVLVTSQHSQPFFERFGFVAIASVRDGFAPGLDSVEMCLAIATGDAHGDR
ncbi:GNAT family N-acetyltransferase [Nocardia sp. NPDC005746]|uniref:GNAT family N-acetyltransferase n=1 Tax=Nocardia sp. NPDC005746 TaxID=3157062 RepID=UPI0033CAC6FB